MRTFPNPTSPASDPAILNRTSHALEECPYGHTTNFFTKGSCVRSDAVRRFPALLRMAASDRQGATLLVTLGILTVLSVMVITYLVAARLQRQTAAVDQNRLVARNYMDAALHLAMRQVEDSLTYPNYSDHDISAGEYLTPQRLAPVDRWFGEHYSETNQLSKIISFQATDVLASPAFSNAPTVNLLTPQVLRLIPSALTNGLVLSSNALRPFRSGWIPLDILPDSAPTEMRLRSKSARIAFTVFNCSGLIDANTFPFLNGIAHFLPNAKLGEVTETLRGLEAEFWQAKDKFVEAEALERELEEEIAGMLARITEAEALLRRKAELQRQRMADLREGQVRSSYAQFTCFTGTKVHILTPEALQMKLQEARKALDGYRESAAAGSVDVGEGDHIAAAKALVQQAKEAFWRANNTGMDDQVVCLCC